MTQNTRHDGPAAATQSGALARGEPHHHKHAPAGDRLEPLPRPDAHMYQRFGEDLGKLLDDSGTSIRSVARTAEIDPGFLARIVRGLEHPTVETLLKIGTAVNATVSLRLYPNAGPAIKDRWQAPMLETLLGHASPRWQRYLEAGVLRPDKGWIDAVLHDPSAHRLVCTELQSELRRLEQMIRWHAAKARSIKTWEGFDRLGDDPAVSQLLVIRRTRANLAVVREFPRQLRTQYPAHPDDAIAALAGTEPWPGAALVWMQVDGAGAQFVPGR
jgi:hypothetical protein